MVESAVIDSLSLKNRRSLSSIRTAGADQVAPPSAERLARTAVVKPFGSNESEIAWAMPLGPNETHGSLARV